MAEQEIVHLWNITDVSVLLKFLSIEILHLQVLYTVNEFLLLKSPTTPTCAFPLIILNYVIFNGKTLIDPQDQDF